MLKGYNCWKNEYSNAHKFIAKFYSNCN